jgi:hypothetical protein
MIQLLDSYLFIMIVGGLMLVLTQPVLLVVPGQLVHRVIKVQLVQLEQIVQYPAQQALTVLQSTKVLLLLKMQILYGMIQPAADYTFIMITAGLMLVLQLLAHQV